MERTDLDLTDRLTRLDTSSLTREHAEIVAKIYSTPSYLTEECTDLLPCQLQQDLQLPQLRQSHHLEGSKIYTTTYVLMPGVDPASVESAIVEEEWNWWKNGKITHWKRTETGGCSFILSPVAFVPSKVGIELNAKTTTERMTAWDASIPLTSFSARFFADFEGPGSYEILALDGGCALRSIWAGVARLGLKKLMPLSMILNMHLGAEAGTVGFPFPKGTGFPGLAQKLAQV